VRNRNYLFQIILAIVLVNASGLILRYFNLDCYVILIGFRFHLSLVLPFLILLRFINYQELKRVLIHPDYNQTFQPLAWIFLPFIIVLAALFILKKIEIGDPDYFYEFGLSSIFDYPIYLVWNFPQLFMFSAFIILIQPSLKFKPLFTALTAILLFAFEFVPIGNSKINIVNIISLIFAAVSASLLVKYYQNIYWAAIIVFTIFWANLLAFGSNSQTMIHILFASQYESWDGFFDVAKDYHLYLLPFQLFITMLIIYFSTFKKRSKV